MVKIERTSVANRLNCTIDKRGCRAVGIQIDSIKAIFWLSVRVEYGAERDGK